MGTCTSKQSKWNEELFFLKSKVGEQDRPKKSVNFRHPLTFVSDLADEELSVDALLNAHSSFDNFDGNDDQLSKSSRSTEGADSIKSSPLPIKNAKKESEFCDYLEITEVGTMLDSDTEKCSTISISSANSCQVLIPENSGVRVIFPEKCLFPPANRYEIAYKIHTDFTKFTDFKKKINFDVKWEEDEWFIGPVPELKILNTQKATPFLKHVCIMVPHCVEKELLPYIRVHYFSPESHKYFKVVKRLDKPDTYIPDSRSDPRECFIVTEDYVFIYTTHFTQFVCTCTKKSRLQVVGVLFGRQRHVIDERKQEVNLRLYLGKPIHKIPDFIQGLIDVEKKAQVCRRYIDWFNINLPTNDIMIEDRLNIKLTSSEGIPTWKPRSEPSSRLLIGDHGYKKQIYFDQLQPCDWCHDRNSPGWTPSEVTRSLIHTYGGRPKPEFSGVCTVEVQKMGESHVVESTSLQFSIDLTSATRTQPPVDVTVVDHLGYAFREVAKEFPKPLNRFFARELGLKESQTEETESRFSRDEKEQTIQYLNLWRNKEGKKASVEQLIAILKRLDPPQNVLADELQKFRTRRRQYAYNPISGHPIANPRSTAALTPPSRIVQRQEPEVASRYTSGGAMGGVPAPGTSDILYSTGSILSTSESVRTQYGVAESSMDDETHRKSIALPRYDASEQNREQRAETTSTRPPSGPLGVNYCQNVGQLEERNDRHQSVTSLQAYTSNGNELNPSEPDATSMENYSRVGYPDDNQNQVVPNRFRSIDEVVEVRDLCRDGSDDDDNDNDNCDGDAEEVPVPKKKATKNQTDQIKMLILTDLVLKEMKPNRSTYVHCQKDLDFSNVMDAVNTVPEFPNLTSVILHCGFKYWKESSEAIESQKFRDQVEEAIDNLDDTYTEASIFLSAVLPCRANKNRVKIDLVNAAIQEVCNQTSAQFIDLTPALINGKTGNIDKSMYTGTVSISSRAANKIVQRLADIVDNNTDCGADPEVPRKLRKNIKIMNGDRYSENGDDEHTVRLRDRGKRTQINLTFIMP